MGSGTAKNLNIKNKTVLVLADFFLPLGNIAPTVQALAKNKNKVLVVGNFLDQSLEDHAAGLAAIMSRKFITLPKSAEKLPEYDIPHMYFAAGAKLLQQMRAGDIAVVENLNLLGRYEIDSLTRMAEFFVNDSFGADELLVKSLAGRLPKEDGLQSTRTKKNLDLFLSRSKKPLVLVLGGNRLAGKEAVLDKLMHKADTVLIGGGAANLFFKISGLEIGKSAVDTSNDEKMIKKLWRDYRAKIKLPIDVVAAAYGSVRVECVKPSLVKNHQRILDIGPLTTLEFSKFIKQARTLVWSGALGRVEEKKFTHGTAALLRLFASRSVQNKTHVVAAASGETILPMLEQAGFLQRLDLALPSSLSLFKALTK